MGAVPLLSSLASLVEAELTPKKRAASEMQDAQACSKVIFNPSFMHSHLCITS